jgi:hypothetical protein
MIVGGIGSRLAGGSFANGATSAAFAYLFNDLGREMYSGQGDYPKEAQPRVTTTTRDISAMLPGTDAATSAQEFWIGQNNPLMGTLATLWTPDHAISTLMTLGGGVTGMFRPYWRYVGPNSAADSGWVVRGWTAPYGRDFAAAKDALQMPFMPTDVRRFSVSFLQPIAGPRSVVLNPNWGGGGGFEWFRSVRFPK